MNKAIQLNECARQVNAEKHRKRIEYTKEWIETVLFPALEKTAADGRYIYCLQKINHTEKLSINLVVETLREKGFYVQSRGSVYTISWEDEYVY